MKNKNVPNFPDQKDRIVSGCAQPQLPIRHLKEIGIFIPPINQQQKFADLVQKVEKIKEKQQEAKRELDNLFNSLMQKVFGAYFFLKNMLYFFYNMLYFDWALY